MTEATMDTTAVTSEVTVAVPIERAWDVFTRDFSTWWPSTHSVGTEPMETCFIEPQEGGRWYERSANGTECDWGRVRAYEPPNRLLLTWGTGADWRPEPDETKHSEVEVTFTAEGDNATRVTLEHRGFDRHAAGGAEIRTAVSSPQGWPMLLDRFQQAAEG